MNHRKNLVKTRRFTVSVSADAVDFLKALGMSGGFDGKSYTEVATTLLLERIKQLSDAKVLQARQETLSTARAILGKNKKKS